MSFGTLVDRVRREMDERQLPSCQLAIARDGELVLFETLGAPDGTRFHIWSCSKAVVASLVWLLVDEGRLAFDDKIAAHLPSFGTNGKDVITVEQVLLHTAGFPLAPMGPAYWATQEGRRDAFARWRLNWEPGSRYQYHELAAGWLLAELASAVCDDEDYRVLLRRLVIEPLGLSTFALGVPEDEQGDIADVVPMHAAATDDDYRAAGLAPLPPPTTPPNAAVVINTPAARAVGIPGGGAVATAADVARFYQSLLGFGPSLWSAELVADVTGVVRNTFPDLSRWGEPASRSRGLVIRGDDEPYSSYRHHFGTATSPATFGHDGAGGQIAWADPASGSSFCFLTSGYDANRVRELLRNQDLSRLAAETAG